MTRRRLLLSLGTLAAGCALLYGPALPPRAAADFAPATLVSGNSAIPFETAGNPALSQDGRYVVFQGTIDGAPGVYRRDLQTGALEAVAAQVNEAVNPVPASFGAPDAAAPSVSADGRYVAFTSTVALDSQAEVPPVDHGCPQVYVRDMDLAPGEPRAYVLASALDASEAGAGTTRAIEYEGGCPTPPEKGFLVAGAQAAMGVALSADGRRVAFTVLSPSNLATASRCTASQECTPPSQVAMRNLDAGTTTVVSVTPQGQPAPGGGAYPSSERESFVSSVSPANFSQASVDAIGSTAAISADGTTVAWLGTNIPSQVPPATDVIEGMKTVGLPPSAEVEPLWRRVAGGQTRRLLDDPNLNFYFTESRGNIEGVDGGSLYPASDDFVALALSADGDTVVTVANAPTSANERSYGFLAGAPPVPTEAYAIRVGDEPAQAPRVTPLTATPTFTAQTIRGDHAVSEIAISPDGSRVAFNTSRTSFALAPPTLISPPAPETGQSYTYEANLRAGTLQRVTRTVDGAPPNGSPGHISLSADGRTLAFASTATNLIFGAPTGEGVFAAQVYVARELPSSEVVAAQSTSPLPVPLASRPDRILSATASSQADGSVIVDAEVPASGRLDAKLTAQLPRAHPPLSRLRGRHPGRRGRARIGGGHVRPRGGAAYAQARRAAAVSKGAPHTRRSARPGAAAIHPTTVAEAATVADGQTEAQLRLRVSARYSALIGSREGLYCLVDVTFTAPGEPALAQTIPVTVRALKRSKSGRGHRAAGRAHRAVRKRTRETAA